MLCSLEPVKCCIRLPNWSGSTIRRSTFSPVCVLRRTPASPGVWAASTSSQRGRCLGKRERICCGRDDVQVLDVSVIRRAEPASSTRSDAGCARSAATSCSPTASAWLSTMRPELPSPSAAAASPPAPRRGSSPRPLAPKPFRVRICWDCAAAISAGTRVDRSSSYSRRARFGPSPGSRVISTSPGGNFARSLTAAGITPSSASAITFSWMIAPTPGSSVARPWRASAVTDTGASRTALAALR